jgi:hypothetical protein
MDIFQRQTQALESQKLKTKLALAKDNVDDSDDGIEVDGKEAAEEEDVNDGPTLPADAISKRINPKDFVLPIKHDDNAMEESEDDEEEQDTFGADTATFDSGIE